MYMYLERGISHQVPSAETSQINHLEHKMVVTTQRGPTHVTT